VGKRIGEFRVRYDGSAGGQETTFGQDSAYSGDELERLRRRAPLHALLQMKTAYRRLSVMHGAAMDGEDVVILAGRTGEQASDPTDLIHVSTRTWLVLRTSKGGEVATFSDFRNVDGVVVPHAIHVQDPLGESTLVLRSLRFDVPLDDAIFKLNLPPQARRPAA
jgi:hypothetical protein